MRALFFSISALSLLYSAPLHADNPGGGIEVTAMPMTAEMTRIEQTVLDMVRSAISGRDSLRTRDGGWIIYADAREADGRVLVSIMLGHRLPEAAIDLAKKGEIFYDNIPAGKKSTLPPEGKWVREKVTEDFMREFVQPIGYSLRETTPELLAETIREILGDLDRTYLQPKKANTK